MKAVSYRIEAITLPVADVDRAKAFYERAGWAMDVDVEPAPGMRIVQLTPPGSAASILMGTVQFAIANGVLDAVRAGYIPKEKANDLGIICSVWLSPGVIQAETVDHKALFDIQRRGMTEAIRKAMTNEPSIDWLLENQDKIIHKYYQMGLDGKI